MKSPIVTFCLLLLSLPARSQGIGDSLIVNLKSGQRVAIPLSDIQKITFDSLGTSAVNSPLPLAGGAGGGTVNYPNPLRTSTTIEFNLPEPGNGSILIFDAKGNLIRHLAQPSPVAAGHNESLWDGLDDHGAPVTSGDYHYEVRFKGQTQTRKMVVIK